MVPTTSGSTWRGACSRVTARELYDGTVPTTRKDLWLGTTNSASKWQNYFMQLSFYLSLFFYSSLVQSVLIVNFWIMEWSNENILVFLDLYEVESAIRNIRHADHKHRNKVYDTWKRIEKKWTVECSFNDLNKEKEHLMTTYRKLASKVKKTKTTCPFFFFKSLNADSTLNSRHHTPCSCLCSLHVVNSKWPVRLRVSPKTARYSHSTILWFKNSQQTHSAPTRDKKTAI